MRFFLRRFAVAAIACGMSLPAWGAVAASSSQQKSGSQKPPPRREAAINFADLGNVWTWRADGSNQMYIQSYNKKWYRVTFWSPCFDLPFAIRIAFVTEPNGNLNKYSSILVHGERCWFKTFEHSEAPPKTLKKK